MRAVTGSLASDRTGFWNEPAALYASGELKRAANARVLPRAAPARIATRARGAAPREVDRRAAAWSIRHRPAVWSRGRTARPACGAFWGAERRLRAIGAGTVGWYPRRQVQARTPPRIGAASVRAAIESATRQPILIGTREWLLRTSNERQRKLPSARSVTEARSGVLAESANGSRSWEAHDSSDTRRARPSDLS